MIKELYVFIGMFLFLTLGMHYSEWLSHPFVHLQNLPSSGAYGLGLLHPFIFTLFGYILLLLPRALIKIIKRKK